MQLQTGCDGNHVVLHYAKLRKRSLSERRKALERSGLCMYCLKHAPELECYGQGGPTKPLCPKPECGGRHTTGAQELLGEVDASINLIAGEDCDSDEDEEWWVNTVRVEGEGENPGEPEDLELGESEGEADKYCISTCMRRDDSGLEEELEYFWDAPIPSETNEHEEDRWWSPGPQGPSSEEKDKEEVRYLVSLLMSEPREGDNEEGAAPSQGGTGAGPDCKDRQAPMEEPEGGGEGPSGDPRDGEPPLQRSSGGGDLGRKKRRVRMRCGKPQDAMPGWENCSSTARKVNPGTST